jgi:formylglycine-generating enzyme required for sulfatase activity
VCRWAAPACASLKPGYVFSAPPTARRCRRCTRTAQGCQLLLTLSGEKPAIVGWANTTKTTLGDVEQSLITSLRPEIIPVVAVEGRADESAGPAKVFISYSRKDMAFADRLAAALKARGFAATIDRAEIYAFEEWWPRIETLVAGADTVIFVISHDSIASEVALKEIAFAASLNKRLAPIIWRRVDETALPQALARLNFIYFDDEMQFETSADRLAEALNTDILWIRQHTEYGEAAWRWSTAGRPSGLLLHSPTLEVAEHWISSRPRGAPEPTDAVRAFVVASRQGVRSAQRLRQLARSSIFTLMAIVILGLVGWINQAFILEQWRWYWTVRPFLSANISPYVLTPAAERMLKPKDIFRECLPEQQDKNYCPDMVAIPAGSFMMGAPQGEKDSDSTEEPLHAVTIDKPFAISKSELTFAAWDTCVAYGDCPRGLPDSGFGRNRQPVINATWDDAQKYVAWLSKITGKPYRLLSEAEYEYATRAGTTTAYPWGDQIGKNNANCDGCGSQWDNKQTAPVGSFAANAFGLYDMVGNVIAWVADCAHDNYAGAPTDGAAWIGAGNCDRNRRVLRGGAWDLVPLFLRSANRFRYAADDRTNSSGIRVGRTLLAP